MASVTDLSSAQAAPDHADGPDTVPPIGYAYPEPPPVRRSAVARLFAFLFVRQSWVAPLAVLACFGMSVAYVEHFNPTTGEPGPTGGCAFKALTGLDCPGCGGTRAFWYLLHGNLPEAARNHVLAVFAAPFLVYAYVAWTMRRVFGITVPRLRIPPLAMALFAVAWAALFVLRNLPWAPFTYLYV
jgi:hypothetical protein